MHAWTRAAALALSPLTLACSAPEAPRRARALEPIARAQSPDLPQETQAATPEPAAEGHARMVAALEVAASEILDSAPYLGAAQARSLRQQLATNTDPRLRLQLQYQLGLAELRLGREDEAVAQLEAAVASIEGFGDALPPKLAAVLRYNLGVAYLRLGEARNCCLRNTAESCLMPIQGGGVHVEREGSEKALATFIALTKGLPPEDRTRRRARWLLNVAAMTLGEHPQAVPKDLRIPAAAFTSESDFPRFPNVAQRVGLARESLAGGAVVDDFDGDGLLDVVVSSWRPDAPLALMRNLGDGRFEDQLARSGLEGIVGGLNLAPADYDNDGDLDLLVLRGAWLGAHGHLPNSLLRNDGDWRFTDVTFDAGMGARPQPTQVATWADIDNDGDLDVFVCNEASARDPAPSQLWRGDGDGRFVDIAAAAGVTNDRFCKGASWGDIDNDGDPDLYISNLGAHNRLLRNDTEGERVRFVDISSAAGVIEPIASFPTWFWDYDNDGNLDLFVAAYEADAADTGDAHLGLPSPAATHRLYRGDGRGGFTDVTARAGLTRPTSVMGSSFADVDNDGLLDMYLGTGAPPFDMLMPNQLLRGAPGGAFEDVTYAAGLGHLQKGHGVAFADLDHDGDLDVFEQLGGAYPGDDFADSLYENPGFPGRRWISLELVGTRSNRAAIGARVHLRVRDADGGERSIHRHVTTGGSFGASPRRVHIGLGEASAIESLELRWPGASAPLSLSGLPLDAHVRVVEGAASFELVTRPAATLGGA